MENLIGEENVMNIMEKLVDFSKLHGGAEEDDTAPTVDAETDATLCRVRREQLKELEDVAAMKPTRNQARVLRALTHARAGVHVVSGGPGTGKTFVLKHLVHLFRKQGRKAVVAATSGPAATRISKWAQTVHSAFGVFGEQGNKGKYLSPLSPVNPLHACIANTDVFIIDEMSMLSSDLLSVVLYRIKTCCGYSSVDEVLKRKVIILVGDHCQLPPVCNHRTPEAEFCKLCHVSSHPVWAGATKYFLQHSVRHAADAELAAFLDIIRRRKPTQAEIDTCFSYPGAILSMEEVRVQKLTPQHGMGGALAFKSCD